ncbi:MAG: hypothetical protein MI923_12035 [Phycisphaerales bacterium]|nr:hypothetical protein [Phycisphaerales bacterium]
MELAEAHPHTIWTNCFLPRSKRFNDMAAQNKKRPATKVTGLSSYLHFDSDVSRCMRRPHDIDRHRSSVTYGQVADKPAAAAS